jgi:hypothetical protein
MQQYFLVYYAVPKNQKIGIYILPADVTSEREQGLVESEIGFILF